MVKKINVVLLTVILVFGVSCGYRENRIEQAKTGFESEVFTPIDQQDGTQEQTQGETQEQVLMPNFLLKNKDGKEISLEENLGKVVVLNFWASWCPPCKAEMPEFQKYYDELKEAGDEEVSFFLIDQVDGQRETSEKGTAFLEENGITIENVFDDLKYGYETLGVGSYPTTVVVGKDGYIYDVVVGQTNYEKVKEMVEGAKNVK